MPIISKTKLYEQPEQHVLSIRKTINFSDFAAIAKDVFDLVTTYADRNGILFSSGPFVCYHNTDLENLDVEMGFQVAKHLSGNDEIMGHLIPTQKVVSGLFLGGYADTDPLTFEIMQWIADNGFIQKGTIFNYYLSDEDNPTYEQLTQIVIPVN